jgi:hypothetical protein
LHDRLPYCQYCPAPTAASVSPSPSKASTTTASPKSPSKSSRVSLVKPDITFFGESLPERFHQSLKVDFSGLSSSSSQAATASSTTADTEQYDVLIVMGTSLQVHPFASLINFVDTRRTFRILMNNQKVGESYRATLRNRTSPATSPDKTKNNQQLDEEEDEEEEEDLDTDGRSDGFDFNAKLTLSAALSKQLHYLIENSASSSSSSSSSSSVSTPDKKSDINAQTSPKSVPSATATATATAPSTPFASCMRVHRDIWMNGSCDASVQKFASLVDQGWSAALEHSYQQSKTQIEQAKQAYSTQLKQTLSEKEDKLRKRLQQFIQTHQLPADKVTAQFNFSQQTKSTTDTDAATATDAAVDALADRLQASL